MEKEIAQNDKSNLKIFWKYANSKSKTNTGISELKYKSEEGEERKTTTDKEQFRNQTLAHRRIKYSCYRL
jgi:hypothetical protein